MGGRIRAMDERQLVRFGVYELDLRTGELLRQGRPVQVQQQPLTVLKTLIERPGELVTRDELRRRLWPEGITVDFDQSLNKCVTKLRSALRDSVASPRFIETLPKRGYRFIAPVEAPRAASVAPVASVAAVATPPRPRRARTWGMVGGVGLAIALAVTLTAAWPAEVSKTRVDTPARSGPSPIFAARDAYERGRLALGRRSDESLRLSVEHFQRAIALGPRYAEAHAGLADAWSLLSSYGLVDPREGMPRARDAANRALMLDATLARAHASLARTAMIFDWDWQTAEWHFARAIALDPGAATTHQWFAYLLSALGRHDEAVAAAKRAIAAEPRSPNTNTALGYVLYVARRYDEAAAELIRTLETDPDFSQARRNLALVRVQQGRLTEAVTALARVAILNQDSPMALGELAWAHGLSGHHAEAARLLSQLDAQRSRVYVPPDAVALAHLGAGRRDQAIAWLQRAFTMRVATLSHLGAEPVWDPLRDDARVKQMTSAIRPD